MSQLDDLLNHLVIREGRGPNGSGGELRYWKNGTDIPAKQAIKDLFTKIIRDHLDDIIYTGVIKERIEDL